MPKIWKSVKSAAVPRDAFLVGTFQDNEHYIGRYISSIDGYSFVGPVLSGKGLLSIYGETGFCMSSYEIFLNNGKVSWKPIIESTTTTELPDGAIASVDTIRGKGYIGKHEELGVGMVVFKENRWTYLTSKHNSITSSYSVLCLA